jgi:hypothetical protein
MSLEHFLGKSSFPILLLRFFFVDDDCMYIMLVSNPIISYFASPLSAAFFLVTLPFLCILTCVT